MRCCADAIAATVAEGGQELPRRLADQLDQLDGLLELHASRSSALCDMADRMFAPRQPSRPCDAVRRLNARVLTDREELRARSGSATHHEIARRAFAVCALVRALLEVEAVVVLDPIDRVASEIFEASPEAAMIARARDGKRAGRRASRAR